MDMTSAPSSAGLAPKNTVLDETGFDADKLALQFHNDGFLKLENVFYPLEVQELHALAMKNFNEVMAMIVDNNLEFGIGIKHGFRDIVQRHQNRFEMPYKMEGDEFAIITRNTRVMDVVHEILGQDAVVINKSLLVSMPGAEDQSWHTDGPHVNVTKYEPCHCLNVFLPLVNVDMNNGPTEFRPESQRLSRDLTKMFLAAFMSKKLKSPVTPCIEIGSAVLFDYRVLHRGRANMSDQPRPVLVYTFAKPWHNDTLNFPKFSVADVIARNRSSDIVTSEPRSADVVAEDSA